MHAFYRYFRGLVEAAVGTEDAGARFIAVTDTGTPLERLAKEEGFRRVFINPADIGGRYSVLSYFGLAPAALMGLDAGELLGRAARMRGAAAAPAVENPAALLGAAMGALARQGRDKLTLLAGPGLEGYGLWVEQLLAESTGKDGAGIIPVDGEPLIDPAAYGDDRLFVYPRLQGQDNRDLDEAANALAKTGHPVLRLHLNDAYDLGAEFFRWETAAAVAGHILNIQPFDQPNVQQAKDMTKRLLDAYLDSGALPDPPETPSPDALLAGAKPGDYAAIQVYGPQTDETDEAVAALRRRIAENHQIATTAGYGPRYLPLHRPVAQRRPQQRHLPSNTSLRRGTTSTSPARAIASACSFGPKQSATCRRSSTLGAAPRASRAHRRRCNRRDSTRRRKADDMELGNGRPRTHGRGHDGPPPQRRPPRDRLRPRPQGRRRRP